MNINEELLDFNKDIYLYVNKEFEDEYYNWYKNHNTPYLVNKYCEKYGWKNGYLLYYFLNCPYKTGFYKLVSFNRDWHLNLKWDYIRTPEDIENIYKIIQEEKGE